MIRKLVRLGTMGLAVMLLLNLATAFSAKVTIPQSRVDYLTSAVGVNNLKPAGCSAITVTRLIVGSGTINGVNGVSSLILGGPGADTITGGNWGDCIVGGGGNDNIKGRQGVDVAYGGPGSDILKAEYCYGGPGNGGSDHDTNNGCTYWYP